MSGPQGLVGLTQRGSAGAALFQLATQSLAGDQDQALASTLLDAPQLPGGDLVDPLPDGLVMWALDEPRPEVAVQELAHLAAEPGPGVDAVGDAA